MRTTATVIALGLAALVAIPMPVRAHVSPQAQPPATTQLLGVTDQESQDLLAKVALAQDKLRSGEPVYFQLLSGAPASYAMTSTSPREAFLAANFSHPFSVERLPPANPSWKPFRLILAPNGPGDLLWEVELVLGFYGQIERVEMYYRPPHPF